MTLIDKITAFKLMLKQVELSMMDCFSGITLCLTTKRDSAKILVEKREISVNLLNQFVENMVYVSFTSVMKAQ